MSLLRAAARRRALWGQPAGLSLCEAVVWERCGRLDPHDPLWAAQTRPCAFAGRQLRYLTAPAIFFLALNGRLMQANATSVGGAIFMQLILSVTQLAEMRAFALQTTPATQFYHVVRRGCR